MVGDGEHDHGGLRRRGARHGGREAGGQWVHPGRDPGGGAAHHHHLQQVLPLLPATESSGGVSEEQQPQEDAAELRGEPGEDDEEGSDGDSRCLDDDDIDDIEEDDIDYEDEGGVINYSYVEHPSYTSILRMKELHQL